MAQNIAEPQILPVCTARNHVRIEADELPFWLYMKDPDRFQAILDTHWEVNADWIRAEMERRDLAWIVVAGRNVLASSSQASNLPDELDLNSLGCQYGYVAFAYIRDQATGEIVLAATSKERRKEKRVG